MGRYDYVAIAERSDENINLPRIMRRAIDISDDISSKTLIGVKSEEVVNLL